jgi:thioester reductase-like protein
VSSIAVFDSHAFADLAVAGEDEDLSGASGFHGAYDETKWVGERVIEIGRSRGIPISIYRPGNIAGHSVTGACSRGHLVSAMLKGCIALGLAPDSDAFVDVVPVDYVSSALVFLSRHPETLGTNLNLVNPTHMRWRAIVEGVQAAGYPLELVSLSDWRDAVRARSEDDNALRVFIPMLEERALFSGRRYRCERVLDGLSGSGIACPPLDASLLATYLRRLVDLGELPAPATPSEHVYASR